MLPQRFGLMPALGADFRSAREARGLTLSEVAEQIHIRSVYLNAIENEDWKAIGAAVYVRGFIRTYARFLGLDAEDAVARFNQTAPPERSTAITTVAIDDDERTRPSVWVILGSLVALTLVAFVAYEYWQFIHAPASKPVVAATAAPQPTPTVSVSGSASGTTPSPTTPGPALGHQLAIRLTQASWMRVTVDGATVYEGILPAGTTRTFHGGVVDLRVGNAGGVLVSAGGRPPVVMGKDGDVVEQRYTL